MSENFINVSLRVVVATGARPAIYCHYLAQLVEQGSSTFTCAIQADYMPYQSLQQTLKLYRKIRGLLRCCVKMQAAECASNQTR